MLRFANQLLNRLLGPPPQASDRGFHIVVNGRPNHTTSGTNNTRP